MPLPSLDAMQSDRLLNTRNGLAVVGTPHMGPTFLTGQAIFAWLDKSSDELFFFFSFSLFFLLGFLILGVVGKWVTLIACLSFGMTDCSLRGTGKRKLGSTTSDRIPQPQPSAMSSGSRLLVSQLR